MDILRIKSEEGEWVGIPAIKGENAYEIAVAHGYEGTQEEWLASLKGEKGDKGEGGTRIFEFPFKGYKTEVGETYQFGSLQGLEEFYGQTFPDIDSWREGDYFLSEEGKMLTIEGMVKTDGVVRFITVKCFADIMGKDGKDGTSPEGAMRCLGSVDKLPDTAEKGDVYKVTSEIASASGKYAVPVLGVWSITDSDIPDNKGVDMSRDTAFYEALHYAYYGGVGELGDFYATYYYKDGTRYTLPWITAMNHEDKVLISEDSNFESLAKNGNTIVFEFENTEHLPEVLKQYAVKYPANTSFCYNGEKWEALDSDVIIDLVMRVKALENGGVGGDAGLADEKNYMVFKDVVDVLPHWANEGEVYKTTSDYVAEKQYNNPDNFSYNVDYIGENYVVIRGDLIEYFKEAYEKSTTKSGYLMFYNGEYSEEFYFTVENVEGDGVTFANADQSTLERVFSSPVEYFAIYNVLIVHKGTSAVYHNGEWVEL